MQIMFAARLKEKTRVTIKMRRCDLDRYNVGAPRSMPASARGPAKASLPLQTRITPPSTPVLPLSPRKAARVQHLPQPLVPSKSFAYDLPIERSPSPTRNSQSPLQAFRPWNALPKQRPSVKPKRKFVGIPALPLTDHPQKDFLPALQPERTPTVRTPYVPTQTQAPY